MDDKTHGYGTYKHANGSIYEGLWQHDMQHGNGNETWPDGSNYIGEFVNGKKEG